MAKLIEEQRSHFFWPVSQLAGLVVHEVGDAY